MIEICTNGAADHTTTPTPRTGTARHGPDFRSVNWFGTEYTFTATQAAVIRQLWEAWENGTPDVGTETLLSGAGAESDRLASVFRDHPAWKTVITSPAKGLVRLAVPEDARPDAPASIESPPAPLPATTPPPAPTVDVVGLLVQLLGEPRPLDLSLTLGGWRLTVRLAPDATPMTATRQRQPRQSIPYTSEVVAVMREAGHSMTRSEIQTALLAQRIDVSDRTLARWLPRMVEAGLLISSRMDGYSLPEWSKPAS